MVLFGALAAATVEARVAVDIVPSVAGGNGGFCIGGVSPQGAVFLGGLRGQANNTLHQYD